MDHDYEIPFVGDAHAIERSLVVVRKYRCKGTE